MDRYSALYRLANALARPTMSEEKWDAAKAQAFLDRAQAKADAAHYSAAQTAAASMP